MRNKVGPKGGRGKSESYTTAVLRVPSPLVNTVRELIQKFHEGISTQQQPQPVITQLMYKQIDGEILRELILFADGVNKKYRDDENYVATEEDTNTFNKMWAEVEEVLSQYDNAPIAKDLLDYDYGAISKLIRYRLVSPPAGVTPATASECIDFQYSLDNRCDSKEELIKWALEKGRWDIFVALHSDLPIDRLEYWTNEYQRCIKENIKPRGQWSSSNFYYYWSWRHNAEAFNICPELTALLNNIPEPGYKAGLVLEHLRDNTMPFVKTTPVRQERNGYVTVFIGDNGHFAQYEALWENRYEYLSAFYQWHQQAIATVGEEQIINIYKVLFGADRQRIDEIINFFLLDESAEWFIILGVNQNATLAEIKAAYRAKSLKVHPDVNKSENANQQFIKLQNAYQIGLSSVADY